MEESIAVLKRDRRFSKLIEKHGLPDLKRSKNFFQSLVRSIVYQQLAGKAAATIFDRFVSLFKNKKFPTPEEINKISIEKLRSVGLSSQKASYIKDLAQKFSDGTIKQNKLNKMTTGEIIEHLTQVKGVGVWTVHMFLIFTLNRLDILPTGDLGIKKGFQIVYKLKQLPTDIEMEKLAKPWRSHASIASWYLWRAADEKKK